MATVAISAATEAHVFERGASGWTERLPPPPARPSPESRTPIVDRDASGNLRLMLPTDSGTQWRFYRPDASEPTGWYESPILIGARPDFLGDTDRSPSPATARSPSSRRAGIT